MARILAENRGHIALTGGTLDGLLQGKVALVTGDLQGVRAPWGPRRRERISRRSATASK
jgi:hypothetical protein